MPIKLGEMRTTMHGARVSRIVTGKSSAPMQEAGVSYGVIRMRKHDYTFTRDDGKRFTGMVTRDDVLDGHVVLIENGFRHVLPGGVTISYVRWVAQAAPFAASGIRGVDRGTGDAD